jgi:energy-coupling factor transporter ATP-binding protein EcfA2
MNEKMATALKIAGACRMNIVISGGTGSGKTTMLNAMSKMIDPGERVLTIEDAAELRLQQPHWLPLETRPPNLEGQGAITIGDLVKNALRMRPDRIILGEIRGAECFRPARRDEHRPRWFDVHASRQQPARMPRPYGKHDPDGRHQDPQGSHQPPDRRIGRSDRAGEAPARRFAPHHQHHRSDRDGRRCDRHPGCSSSSISTKPTTARSSASSVRRACAPIRWKRPASSGSIRPIWKPVCNSDEVGPEHRRQKGQKSGPGSSAAGRRARRRRRGKPVRKPAAPPGPRPGRAIR